MQDLSPMQEPLRLYRIPEEMCTMAHTCSELFSRISGNRCLLCGRRGQA